MVTRTVVGARYGLTDWLAQRVTASIMALYTVVMAVLLLGRDSGYEGWRALMANGAVRFFTFLFIVSLCYHAWVGVRDIWMDYVKPVSMRLMLHVLTLLALVGYAGWAVQIIWRL